MVDTADLKSASARSAGSNPALGTVPVVFIHSIILVICCQFPLLRVNYLQTHFAVQQPTR